MATIYVLIKEQGEKRNATQMNPLQNPGNVGAAFFCIMDVSLLNGLVAQGIHYKHLVGSFHRDK